MNPRVLNLILFQIAWFTCVLAGDVWASVVSLAILIVHARFIVADKREWLLIFGFALCGCVIDSILAITGLFDFGATVAFIPIWLICLWLMFATTLTHGFAWLQGRWWFASLLGGTAGAGSYYAGSQMAAVSIAEPL